MATIVLTPTLMGHDGLSCLSRQVVQALAASHHSVDVLVLDNAGGGHVWPSNVAIADAHGRRPEFVWRVLQLAREVSGPSLVVVLHAHLLSSAWPLLRRGAALLPVLVGIEAWKPFSWAQRRVIASADRAVAISHHTAREFKRANQALGALTVDVCWPATPPLVEPVGATLPGKQPYALIVARMSFAERYKGHDLLIDLWPEVTKAAPGARLVIAGTGDDVVRLQRRVQDGGLDNAIEFAGPQTPAALSALYRNAAFLVMPSPHEGFGLVFLEAMSAGRACIGAPGSAQEIIVEGETGLIADPSQPRQVRDAIIQLFQQPELAARMGQAGQRRARELFSMERFTRELSAIVDRIAPARAAAAC